MHQLSLEALPGFSDEHQGIAVEELFEAYFNCRKNKRNTLNALAFEINYEQQLIELHRQINNGSYKPGRSIAFVVSNPVKREIFAADFRDRVVHHLLVNKLNDLFEKSFIYDSYACRKGKGTHLGVNRLNSFIRKCSKNYTAPCYVLKMDIRGFFMHIKRSVLFGRLKDFILAHYHDADKHMLISLCHIVIHTHPPKNCIIKGKRSDWNELPNEKSLFYSPPGCGLPIGNITSQIFANFYMNPFDHYMKNELGLRYYGRYVDDFFVVHPDADYLRRLIGPIRSFLQSQLHLKLHPDKTFLQHYTKGVPFLGKLIKPHRIYCTRRIFGSFYQAVYDHNACVRKARPTPDQTASFLSSMNSYLGIMKHYKTYRLRRALLFKYLSNWWWNRFRFKDRNACSLKSKTRVVAGSRIRFRLKLEVDCRFSIFDWGGWSRAAPRVETHGRASLRGNNSLAGMSGV